MPTSREKLILSTARAYKTQRIRANNRDDMMNTFVQEFKNDNEVLDWLRDNDPFDSNVLYKIFDDAIDLERKPVIDGSPKPTKPPRKNPDLLSDDTASEYFAQVPGSLVRDTSVSAMAFRVYVALMLRAGSKEHCWPSQELIAKEVGLPVVTVAHVSLSCHTMPLPVVTFLKVKPTLVRKRERQASLLCYVSGASPPSVIVR